MSKAGQNNQKGILAQNWAAMSLFLQFLRTPNFSYIQPEPNNSEDFDLVFTDGKTIICEAKFRKEKFGHGQLKELLDKILKRRSVSGQDEILVICKNAKLQLLSDVKNVRFFPPIKKKFQNLGFDISMIQLLPRVNFWVLDKGINESLNYALVAELINIWLPPEEIIRFTDSILQNKISQKATTGSIYSRADFEKDVLAIKNEVQQRSDQFNDKVTSREQQFKLLQTVVKKKRINWGTGSVSAFSSRWDLMSFAMDRLKTRTDINLKMWDDLWQLNRVYYFTFGIFDIFRNNLNNDANRKYVLDYIKKYTKTIRGFYRSDFFDIDVVKILTKIIEDPHGNKYFDDAFLIVKDLILFNEQEFFYLKDNGYDRKEWEKGEICKLLHKLYSGVSLKIKQKIFSLLVTGFNLTEDDGEFSHYSPREIFAILEEWLNEDFENRFQIIVKIIANQYDKFYKKFGKKLKFNGWEHMGGGISFGGSYRAYDRHFVAILSSAIEKFYRKNPSTGWNFIVEKCLSTETKVGKYRPDFLNRAIYEIVLERYASENEEDSKEAFKILKEWMLSKRGIPHKSDLIYQSVSHGQMDQDKKWRLVEVTTKKYNVPVNPFVEQIVADLAKSGFEPAKKELIRWYDDPKYYKQASFIGNSLNNIRQLLEADFKQAVGLFKSYIGSEYFVNDEKDNFHSYDVARLMNDILTKDNEVGIEILQSLIRKEKITGNEQIILCYGMFNSQGNDNSDDPKLLEKVYSEIIDPFLQDNNLENILKKITGANSREGLVKFAGRLSSHKKIQEALRIIEVFINDPDPYLPGEDPNDPENKHNEHLRILKGEEPRTITSVRGWCAWVLMQCSVLAGRPYLRKIIELSGKLSKDQNYYVVYMSCHPLGMLAKNRLTVLPSDIPEKVLFFDDDVEKALKLSKFVEQLVFNLVEKIKQSTKEVQKALTNSMLHALDNIRALNTKDAAYLIETLMSFPEETLNESAPLFIYFAEFRKDSYKDWKWSRPGLYDDLSDWDSTRFENYNKKTIESVKNPDNLFKFGSVCEHLMREAIVGNQNEKQNIEIALKYFSLLKKRYSHHLFQIIYMTIQESIERKDCFESWYDLYIDCLRTEAAFYEDTLKMPENMKDEKFRGMYWWPYMDNFDILEKIYKLGHKDKFFEAADIIFSFPKELEIHERDSIIDVLKQNIEDPNSKKMLKRLIDKNPSKYWELNKLI